ncbi:hypothetical protein [Clostridioides difficile]|uniref:hypothetical protein n=1 Tax=Clostridioides difficile TaxID=1496 RepID=UPI00131B2AF2|nr:hypothetical protein [Clostridioides difficile]HBE9444584.1 hypothetical protein [Clostridioides difficile]
MNLIYKSFNTEQGDETFTDCIFIWNISKLLDYLKSSNFELVNLEEPVIVIDGIYQIS